MMNNLRRWYESLLRRTPPWSHGAIHGATLVLVSFTPGLVIGGLVAPEVPLQFVPLALVWCMLGGTFAGAIYCLLGNRLQRVPMIGNYLAGAVVTAGFALSTIGPLLLLTEPTANGAPVPKGLLWIGLIPGVLVGGVIVGSFLRHCSPSPTKR